MKYSVSVKSITQSIKVCINLKCSLTCNNCESPIFADVALRGEDKVPLSQTDEYYRWKSQFSVYFVMRIPYMKARQFLGCKYKTNE